MVTNALIEQPGLGVLSLPHRENVPPATIQTIVQSIAEQFKPKKIILFGSYAYGQPQLWSAVDLLVVMDTALTPREQRLQISRQFYHHPFRLDILVRTPADLARRLEEGDFFLLEITRRGRVMYEKPDR